MPPSPERRTILRPLPLARHTSPGFPPRGTVWVVERLGRFSRLVYSSKGAPLLPLLDKVIAAFSTRRIDYTTPSHGLLVDAPHHSLRVHAIWHLRVSDPKRLAYRISDVDRCLDALVHSRLRDTINAQPIQQHLSPALLQRMSDTVRAGVDVTSQKFGVTCPAFRISSIQPANEHEPRLPSLPPPSQVKSLVLADSFPGGVAENDLGEVESVLPELPTPQRAPPPVLSDSPDDDSATENQQLRDAHRDVLYAPPPSPTDPLEYRPDKSDILPELLGRVMNRRQQFDHTPQPSNSQHNITSNYTYSPALAKYLDTLPPTPHLDISSNEDSDPQDEVEVFASRTIPANRPAPIPVNLSDDDHPLFRGDYPQPLHAERFVQRTVDHPIAPPPSPPPLPKLEETNDALSEQTTNDVPEASAPVVQSNPPPTDPPLPSATRSPPSADLSTEVAVAAGIATIATIAATPTNAPTPSTSVPSTPVVSTVEPLAAPTPSTATIPAPLTIPPYNGVPPTPTSYNGMPPPPPPAPATTFPQLPPTPYSGVLPTPSYNLLTPMQAPSTIVQSMQLSMGPASQFEGSSLPAHRDVLGQVPYDALSLAQLQRQANVVTQGDNRVHGPLRNDIAHQHLHELSLLPHEGFEHPQMEIKGQSLSDITAEQSISSARDPLLQHENTTSRSTQDFTLPRPQSKVEGGATRTETGDEISSTEAVRDEEMIERGEKRPSAERARTAHSKSSSSRQEARKRRGQVSTSNHHDGNPISEKPVKSTSTVLTSDVVECHVKSQGSTQHSASTSEKNSEVRRKTYKSQSNKSGTREAPRRTEREKKRFAGSSDSLMNERGRPSWAASGRSGGVSLEDATSDVGPEGGRSSRASENSRQADHDVAKDIYSRPLREKAEWLRSKEEEEILSHREHVRRGKLMDVLESIEKSHAGNTAGGDRESSGDESPNHWVDAASDSDSQFFGKSVPDVPTGSLMEVSSTHPRRRSKSRSHHKKESREQASSKGESSSDEGVCRECDHHHRHFTSSHHSDSHNSRSRSHSRRVQTDDDEEGDISDHISDHRSTSRSGRSRSERRGSEEGRRSDHSSRERSHRSKKSSSRERKSDRDRDHSTSKSRSGEKKHAHQKSSSKSRKASSRDPDYERKKSKSKSKSSKPRRPPAPTVYTYTDPDLTPIYRHRLPLSEEEVVHPIPWYCEGQSAPEDTTDPEPYADRRSSDEDSRIDSLQTSTTTYSSYGQRDKYGRRKRSRHRRKVTFLYDDM